MADVTTEDKALGTMILIEELLLALAKSGVVSERKIADVVRATIARLIRPIILPQGRQWSTTLSIG